MSLCCFTCCRCCKKQTDYLKDIDTTTRLLPENKNSKLDHNNSKIVVLGKIYPESNKESIELNKSLVRKITTGNDHMLVLFNDGSLFALGKNNYGQLGLKLTKDNNTFNELKQLVLNNSVLEKLKITKYEVSDIACGDNFSLVLITFGSSSAIVRFGIKEEDKYKDNFEQTSTVVSGLIILNTNHTYYTIHIYYTYYTYYTILIYIYTYCISLIQLSSILKVLMTIK